MRKNLLAKSIATMIAGFGVVGAHAMQSLATPPTAPANVLAATTLEFNENGIGHSLLVPYYTVQGSEFTLFNIQNTDMLNGKAVKVRFRGAENSDDVYDITVLLSPGDWWGAAITRTGGAPGVAQLTTADNSCTLPQGTAAINRAFVTSRLTGSGQTAASTLEGYVEVFNMADIPPVLVGGGVNPVFTAIKHSAAGVPPGCTSVAVNNLFNDPADSLAAQAAGLGAPTTGLMGSWSIVNGPLGTAYSGAATAVEARENDGQRPGYGNIVFFPQSNASVSVGNARLFTADPVLRGGVADPAVAGLPGSAPGAPGVAALLFDFPDMSTPYIVGDIPTLANGSAARRQAFRLSRALAVSSISNEYVTGVGLQAATDWTLSSPSRRYSVARNYTTAPASTVFTNLAFDDAAVATAPVNVTGGIAVNPYNFYNTSNTTVATVNANGGATPYGVICVTGANFAGGATDFGVAFTPNNLISGQVLNTEEGAIGASPGQFVVSPGTPTVQRGICGEVSVLSWNAPAPASGIYPQSVLNAQLTRFDLTSANAAGWARIATPGLVVAAGQGLGVSGATSSTRGGLPFIGSAMIQYTNNAATTDARTIGNYDATLRHRATTY
jgi:hypothetical protein